MSKRQGNDFTCKNSISWRDQKGTYRLKNLFDSSEDHITREAINQGGVMCHICLSMCCYSRLLSFLYFLAWIIEH